MRNIVKSILLAFFATAPGCINADPSNFAVDAGAAVDAAPPDIVIDDDAGDAPDPNAACRACLEAPEDPGPGCKTLLDACKASEKCVSIYECGFANGCWGLAAVVEIQLCGYQKCLLPLGIPLSDPAVMITTAMVECDIAKCNPNPCGPTP